MNEWGVTDKGFYRPTYSEILEEVQYRAHENYGTDLNFSVRTFVGLFMRIIAWFVSILFQIAEATYHSGYVDTARGLSLFLLGKHIGIKPLKKQKAIGEITVEGSAYLVIPEGFIVATKLGMRFITLQSATIPPERIVKIPVQAFEAGLEGNVEVGAVTEVVTPLPHGGIKSIVNELPMQYGRDEETEEEFRDRYVKSTDKPGGSNTDAIRAALLETNSVAAAIVFENDTDIDQTPGGGLPPHSIEAIVFGGLDLDIAKTIFKAKAAGIQTYGGENVLIYDIAGIQKNIHFSRPRTVPVWVRVTGLKVNEAEQNVTENVIDAIINHIGGISRDGETVFGLGIGVSVNYNRVICPVNEVAGVLDYTLEISPDGVNYSRNNIDIDMRSVAQIAPERIVVSS